MTHAGAFCLVSGAPAGALLPIRTASIPYPYDDDLDTGGGFLLYAQVASGVSGDWRPYTAATGVPVSAPATVEWITPTRSTLIAATARAVDDPAGRNGQVELYAPMPGKTAVGTDTGPWLLVGAPNTGHGEDSWLTESSPAMVAGSFGPHGSLEMCLAIRDGGFRHLYADATDPGNLGTSGELRAWNTSGVFSSEYHFDGIALVQDAFSNHLLIAGVTPAALILNIRDSALVWGTARSMWSPPAGATIVGVPAVWQQQLPPAFGPAGIHARPGDFLIAVGLSDGSAQLLRLPYATAGTADAAPASEPLAPSYFGKELQQIVALGLTQSPLAGPISPWSEFTDRPVELYSYYGAGASDVSFSVLNDDGSWGAASSIPSGVAHLPPKH